VSERKVDYQLNCHNNGVTMESQRPLCTRNLDELDRELAELERMLTPLVNKIRELRGKKPMFVPKG